MSPITSPLCSSLSACTTHVYKFVSCNLTCIVYVRYLASVSVSKSGPGAASAPAPCPKAGASNWNYYEDLDKSEGKRSCYLETSVPGVSFAPFAAMNTYCGTLMPDAVPGLL